MPTDTLTVEICFHIVYLSLNLLKQHLHGKVLHYQCGWRYSIDDVKLHHERGRWFYTACLPVNLLKRHLHGKKLHSKRKKGITDDATLHPTRGRRYISVYTRL